MQKVSSDKNEDLRYEVDFGDRAIVVRCEGKVWPGPFFDLMAQSVDACIAAGRRGVLVDIRACHGTAPSTSVRHEVGVGISELQNSRAPLVVMAVLGSEPFVDPGRFAEMVAVQHNAVFRVFTSEPPAHEWLQSQIAMRETTVSPPLN